MFVSIKVGNNKTLVSPFKNKRIDINLYHISLISSKKFFYFQFLIEFLRDTIFSFLKLEKYFHFYVQVFCYRKIIFTIFKKMINKVIEYDLILNNTLILLKVFFFLVCYIFLCLWNVQKTRCKNTYVFGFNIFFLFFFLS